MGSELDCHGKTTRLNMMPATLEQDRNDIQHFRLNLHEGHGATPKEYDLESIVP